MGNKKGGGLLFSQEGGNNKGGGLLFSQEAGNNKGGGVVVLSRRGEQQGGGGLLFCQEGGNNKGRGGCCSPKWRATTPPPLHRRGMGMFQLSVWSYVIVYSIVRIAHCSIPFLQYIVVHCSIV